MTTTRTIAQIAKDTLEYFEHRTREDGSKYWSRKDPAPDWVQEMCFEAHDDMMPDDYKYRFIVDALQHFVDCESETEDEAHDHIYEIEPDVYTDELLEWISSNLGRLEYCDNSMKEYQPESFALLLAAAQTEERQQVAHIVLEHLVKQA